MLLTNQCTPQVVSPQILWDPKNPQTRHTTKAYVSSCGSVTYGVPKELTNILKPLVGKSPHPAPRTLLNRSNTLL